MHVQLVTARLLNTIRHARIGWGDRYVIGVLVNAPGKRGTCLRIPRLLIISFFFFRFSCSWVWKEGLRNLKGLCHFGWWLVVAQYKGNGLSLRLYVIITKQNILRGLSQVAEPERGCGFISLVITIHPECVELDHSPLAASIIFQF